MLAYNEFAYKKTKDHRELHVEDRFQKKAIFQSHMHEIADKRPHIMRAACIPFLAIKLSHFIIKTIVFKNQKTIVNKEMKSVSRFPKKC